MTKYSGKIISVILFGIIIVQPTIVPQLAIYGVVPNLAVAFLIALTITGEIKNIFKTAFLIGLILDIFSGLPFGIITVGLILAVFTISALSSKFLKSYEFFILAPIVFLGLLIYNLALLILSNLSDLSFVLENARQAFSIFASKTAIELILVLISCKFIKKLQ